MRSKASHPGPHQTCVPASPASPPRRWHDCFGRAALERSAALCRSQWPIVLLRSRIRDCCGGPATLPAPRSKIGGGGRNARATSSHSRAFSGVSPGNSVSRITGCHWLCRNHPASSGTLTFRWRHFPAVCCVGQYKKEQRLCRNCGGRDFPVDERGKLRINTWTGGQSLRVFNSLHTVKGKKINVETAAFGGLAKAKPSD